MKLKISEIKSNGSNPRTIKDEKFRKLVESIRNFPEMLDAREIIVNKDHVILGGNMRFLAAKEAGMKEVPVKIVDWSQDKQDEFIVKDNTSSGEWDWDVLAKTWDEDLLVEWGVFAGGEIASIDKVNNLEDTEWVGMPEFETKEQALKLIISFDNEEDRKEFFEQYPLPLLKQSGSTWSTWFPYRQNRVLKGTRYEFDE